MDLAWLALTLLPSAIDVFNGFRSQGSGTEFNKLLKLLKS